MNSTLRRTAPSVVLAVALLLTFLVPVVSVAQESDSSSGEVTVKVVPPGTLPEDPEDTAKPGAPKRQVGTLSAFVMWLPDTESGNESFSGLVAVQDHRAHASGWTIRLGNGSVVPVHLVQVNVGGTGYGIPDWVYRGIHVWDVAVGAVLGEWPSLLNAPALSGYGLTIHRMQLEVETPETEGSTRLISLMVLIPAAP